MAKYKLEISKSAEKQLKKINKIHQKRIVQSILKLAANPHPRGSKKLKGYSDIFRLRVGTCRIIYSIEDKKLTIIILKIGHRKEVYR